MARLTPLEKTIKEINDKTSYGLKIDEINKYYSMLNNESLLIDILKRIASNPNVDAYTYMERLDFAITVIYNAIVNDKEDLDAFYNMLRVYLSNPDIVTEESIRNISNSFSDKSLVYEVYNYLNSTRLFGESDETKVNVNNINYLSEYLVKAREHYVEDRTLYTSFINLITYILGCDVIKYGEVEQITPKIEEKLREDMKSNGRYDIDEATLREFDRKVGDMSLLRDKLRTLLDIAEKERAELTNSTSDFKDRMVQIRIEEIKSLEDEANKIIKNFNAAYMELVNNQKRTVIGERDKLVSEIVSAAEKAKSELVGLASGLADDVNYQLSRIQTVSNDSIGNIKQYVTNDEKVREAIQSATNNRQFLTRLSVVEKIAANMPEGANSAPVQIVGSQPVEKVSASSEVEQIIVPKKTIVVSDNSEIAKVADRVPIFYFDESKKFKERFKKIMDAKQKLEAEGELFHEKFDDIIVMLLMRDSPYLFGPSGSGKTYTIKNQISKLFDIPVINQGYVEYKQDLLGYTNAGNGDYIPSNFYRAWKFGQMMFFDEVDKSNPNATTVLNHFTERAQDADYTFPNGQLVVKHPNFRLIGAGNTDLSGKNKAYNTGQQQDESVIQRFKTIYFGYDDRIEARSLKNYPAWYEFAIEFRHALENVDNDGNQKNSRGTFTTRDAENVRDYLDSGAWSDEKIMDYEFVETKDITYLMQIRKNMSDYNFKDKESRKLLTLFDSRIESRKRNEKRN